SALAPMRRNFTSGLLKPAGARTSTDDVAAGLLHERQEGKTPLARIYAPQICPCRHPGPEVSRASIQSLDLPHARGASRNIACGCAWLAGGVVHHRHVVQLRDAG